MTATEWLAEEGTAFQIEQPKTRENNDLGKSHWARLWVGTAGLEKKKTKNLSFSQLFIHSSKQNAPENNIALW